MDITPPTIPTPDELYDQLMSAIEPELTLSQAPLLAVKYKDETPEEHAERNRRYEKAFLKFYEVRDAYFADLSKRVSEYRKIILKTSEERADTQEQEQLSQIESLFSS